MNQISIIGKVDRVTIKDELFTEALISTRDSQGAIVLHPCKFVEGPGIHGGLINEGTDVAIDGSMINEGGKYIVLVNNLVIV